MAITGIRNFCYIPSVESTHDLFEYTSGRWIYNEEKRFEERRLGFDVPELKHVAARDINQEVSHVEGLHKLAEGGFNRIFEVRMKDGTSILARLPYPSTLPRRLAVASEVATIEFVRAHGIPAPKILGYSLGENTVKSEYILMEKLSGSTIGDSWFEISEQQRLQVLHDICDIEAKLCNITLPASGSIYYAHDLPRDTPRVRISGLEGRFCVGPYAGLRWWHEDRARMNVDRGPHVESLSVMQAPAKKELDWIHHSGRTRFPFARQYREAFHYEKQDPKVHADSLEKYLHVAPYLVPARSDLNDPIIRHPDLQPNNIFISKDHKVTGLIGWQHAVVLPNFLAAGIPNSFQNYGDDESRSFTPPQLPSDLDPMNEGDRNRAQEEFRRRQVHFFYLRFTQRLNDRHWRALESPGNILTRRIYDHASDPWEGLSTPLQFDLVQIARSWGQIVTSDSNGSFPECAVSFSDEEMTRIDALDDAHRDSDTDIDQINELLGVASDGWTPNERFEESKERAVQIKEQGLAGADDDPWLREMSERHWPWDDFDEDE
ncbi:kinase-like domain-containing protein [Paraphoma chrysanthemicola]|uniref:Kinase-like domain-containing protein n=1 Tax=Paraphoma chrysanthemicola TaxID=798071 RepID=A0A8K0R5T5_9PLEO|nr:kinase-like domain-containing protein [Paraphoma chrysanthemicola]